MSVQHPPLPLFSHLPWSAIAEENDIKIVTQSPGNIVFSTTRYGEIFLVDIGNEVISLRVSTLTADHRHPESFTRVGDGFNGQQPIPFLADGKLIPATVLCYRLNCALSGEPLDLAEGMDSLAATPELILQLKAGAFVESLIESWFCEDDEEPTIRKGDRLRVKCLRFGGDEYEEGSELEPEDLDNINWNWDEVVTEFTEGENQGVNICLLFSQCKLAESPDAKAPEASI